MPPLGDPQILAIISPRATLRVSSLQLSILFLFSSELTGWPWTKRKTSFETLNLIEKNRHYRGFLEQLNSDPSNTFRISEEILTCDTRACTILISRLSTSIIFMPRYKRMTGRGRFA